MTGFQLSGSALTGKRVVNTRAAHQAEALNALLRASEAEPLSYPCIAIAPPDEFAPLDTALRALSAGAYEWLVLTSVNTVLALAERLTTLGLHLPSDTFRAAAIGPGTAQAARAHLGLAQVEVPPEYVAESLAAHLPIAPGDRVLLPESAIARPALADGLTARGAQVQVVVAYQTICAGGGIDLAGELARGAVDALTFTSSSTVTCFAERWAREGGYSDAPLALPTACIGPKTAATARDLGFRVLMTPDDHTLEGLVTALDAFFARTHSTQGQTL
jgi:uroporphyrinogen-III synthase